MHRLLSAGGFLALAVLLVLASVPGDPQPVAGVGADLAATSAGTGAATARAGGLGSWWGEHGKTVVNVLSCVVDGAGLARLMGLGIPGVGGYVAAAAVIVAAVGCIA